MPRLSILLAVYWKNSCNELRECLNSIAAQSFTDFELVVVCDGVIADDLKVEIINAERRLARLGISVTVTQLPENKGLALALAHGVAFCKAEYIVRMDSDDICTADRLELLNDFVTNHQDIDVIGSNIEEFQNVIGDLGQIRRVPCEDHSIKKLAKFRCPMNHVTVCIKRATLLRVGSYEHVPFHEDYYLWLKMIDANATFHNLDRVTVYVRLGNGFFDRRKGLGYVKNEVFFAVSAWQGKFFSCWNVLLYLLPRLVIRTAPQGILKLCYKLTRCSM